MDFSEISHPFTYPAQSLPLTATYIRIYYTYILLHIIFALNALYLLNFGLKIDNTLKWHL